ncbi:MAG: hypothetical protein ACFFG0_10475 [Candidatus Thorarchaeota archaeon]
MKKIKELEKLKNKTLEKIIEKHGTGFGELSNMQLSIWDVRNILYDEFTTIVKSIFEDEFYKLTGRNLKSKQ